MQTEPTIDEIKRLQRCINDLVSVLTLPALWTGRDSARVATTLADVMVRMLDLDFAYVRTTELADGATHEWIRLAGGRNPDIQSREVGRMLEPYLKNDSPVARVRMLSPIAEGSVSIAIFHLGVRDSVGIFVAGAERPGFPTEIERLLMQVSTNQAVVAFQEARYVSQRRRATEELERTVVERTAELTTVNASLRQEILERARVEARIMRDERELRLLLDYVPQLIGVVSPDGTMLMMNRAALDYLGVPLDEGVAAKEWRDRFYHPDDRGAMQAGVHRALSEGIRHEGEARIRRHDGQYRWFLVRHEALRDDQGQVIRLFATAADIDDRRQVEDRVREENLVLREEIDKASMFEEIVGVSPPVRSVLAQVSRVAPTDSTVLITGETGTGKELVARAIHKRSPRSVRAFIGVNCAAMSPSLIASELFGHEKGAFTGAAQRRQGRFELAEGGTVFLDEVGELPSETQVMLLRVLQEREFERVGGSRPIRADVRVIAATNRDLERAVAEKTFRADLYYRLNVFPIEMPPLRERGADIPLLVEYFIHRYSRRMGKKIHGISKSALDLLRAYHWPGNIRELQNVVERAVIVSDSETLLVDERWFFQTAGTPRVPATRPPNTLATRERNAIETALAESQGRVAGPFGAAVRLGVPPTTLESKIKALGIDKRRFRTP